MMKSRTALDAAMYIEPRHRDLVDSSEDGSAVVEVFSEAFAVNAKTISRLGAQVAVMTKLIDVLMTDLTAKQAHSANRQFRAQIGELTSVMRDARLPVEYHSVMLDEANRHLGALRGKSMVR